MFLLCNGLLVFVGIARSFSGSSGDDETSKYVEDDEPSKYIEDDSKSQFLEVEANKPMLEKTSEFDEQNIAADQEEIEIKYCHDEEVEEKIEKTTLVDEEQEKESSQSVLEEEEKEANEENIENEDKGSEADYFLIEENIEDEEEEEEEENCVLSTEELNKKFDDFIRRMKEDLRIEAKRTLVMV